MATQVEIDDWIVKRDKSLRIAQKIKGLLAKAKEENAPQAQIDENLQHHLSQAESGAAGDFDAMSTDGPDLVETRDGQDEINDSINRNTIYEAEYKLVGYNLNIKFRPIAQHYWMCDPTVISIEEQPFCGFYKPMSIQEATELYPDIDVEEFKVYAEYSNVGSYQAGSLLNNLAIHARDSVPINGLPAQGYAAQEPEARQEIGRAHV